MSPEDENTEIVSSLCRAFPSYDEYRTACAEVDHAMRHMQTIVSDEEMFRERNGTVKLTLSMQGAAVLYAKAVLGHNLWNDICDNRNQLEQQETENE